MVLVQFCLPCLVMLTSVIDAFSNPLFFRLSLILYSIECLDARDNPINPENEREIFHKPRKRLPVFNAAQDFKLIVPLVPWGGMYEGDLKLVNTCNLDTTLQCLLALYLYNKETKQFIVRRCEDLGDPSILSAIQHCVQRSYDEAKTVWIRDVLKQDPSKSIRAPGNMYGSEFDNGLKHAGLLFSVKILHSCTNYKCGGYGNSLFFKQTDKQLGHQPGYLTDCISFTPEDFINALNSETSFPIKCSCGSERMRTIDLVFEDPPFLFYTLMHAEKSVRESDIPKNHKIKNSNYCLFAYTVKVGDVPGAEHFLVHFIIDNVHLVYDGQSKHAFVRQKVTNYMVTSVWLLRQGIVGCF